MATPNIVPQATGEGSIGTTAKKWADVQSVKLNGKELTTVAKADSIPVTGAGGKLDGGLLGTHSHAQSDVTDLTTALAGKANTSHSHAQSDVTGLITSLAGKANTIHSHVIADVSTLQGALDAKVSLSVLGKNVGGSNVDPNTTADHIILSNHANSPNSSFYWHITTTFYNAQTSTANRAQIAVQYNGGNAVYARSCYGETWTAWVRCDVGNIAITAGNGLTGGGALSASRTLALGTPGSCSTSTTNRVTSTSHTHAITGVAAASHTHSYQPIPTSYTLPVGTLMYMQITNTSSVADGGTISGSSLRPVNVQIDSSGVTAVSTCTAQAGTWKNISGRAFNSASSPKKYSGLFVRTA